MPWGDVGVGTEAPGARLLGDRYELLRLLGTGGCGAVYLARDTVLGREVAVKVLRSDQDDLAQARLRSEARIAASLTHPGIARLLDVGEHTGALGEAPYLVMEYVDGRTLRQVIRAGERLSTEQVLDMLAQLAGALAAVHGAGIVHRDLKPGNIMLTAGGRAVLLDFGIARHHSGEPLTLTGMIIGTVDYISPEQASGASATTASDLYALGMVAYECLTGTLPLSRDTQISTLMAHATTPVPPLPRTVPAGVRALVEAMVALDPARRPPDAAAVAARARALLRDQTATGLVAVPRSWRSLIPGPGARAARLGARDPRRRVLVAACAVVLLATAAVTLVGRAHAPVAPADARTAVAGTATPSAAQTSAGTTSAVPVLAARGAAADDQASRPVAQASRHPASGRARGHRPVHAASHAKAPHHAHATRPPGRPHGKGRAPKPHHPKPKAPKGPQAHNAKGPGNGRKG